MSTFLALALVLTALPMATLSSTEPLKIEDVIALDAFALRTPIALSPDGDWLAYTIRKPHRDDLLITRRDRLFTSTGVPQESANCELWITNTKSAKSRNLTGASGSSWAPAWSPDGRYLAFYSDRDGAARIWLWERASGRSRQLSPAIIRSYWGFQIPSWSPDGRSVLSRLLPEGVALEKTAGVLGPNVTNRDSVSTVKVFISKPVNAIADAESGSPEVESSSPDLADLAMIDIASGGVRRVAQATKIRGYWFSPDGRSIAITRIQGTVPNTLLTLYDLIVIPVDGNESRTLVTGFKQDYGVSVSWSPDSTLLAFTMKREDGHVDCSVVSVASGGSRRVSDVPHPPFDALYGVPYWDDRGDAIYLSGRSDPAIGLHGSDTVWKLSLVADTLSPLLRIPESEVLGIVGRADGNRLWSPNQGHSLLVVALNRKTKRDGFWKVDVGSGGAVRVWEGDVSLGNPTARFKMDVSSDGQTFVYFREDSQHPGDIWITDPRFEGQRRLTHLNSKIDNVSFVKSRVIEWQTGTGEILHGGLLLPFGYQKGRRYPLIVFVYGGGSQSENVNRFGFWGGIFNLQILAARGYAVLLPDSPVHKGSPMKDIPEAVIPAVDKVVQLGIADAERIGVMGQSYGGYSTLALIIQTLRFKAAVDCAGPTDLVSNYGVMRPNGTAPGIGWSETGQGAMEGSPWQYRDRYLENSPIFFLDRVQTPLLILHGELDDVVPVTQADELFVGLRRLGKEASYARYAGEEHVIGDRRLVNGVDMWNRIISWFDTHLAQSAP